VEELHPFHIGAGVGRLEWQLEALFADWAGSVESPGFQHPEEYKIRLEMPARSRSPGIEHLPRQIGPVGRE
jgi:hypothetical protein